MPETYRLLCTKLRPDGQRRVLSESHGDLSSALGAMLEHQQRPWDSVALVPVPVPHREPTQLALLTLGAP